jgi:hypothetical protein
MRKNEKAKIRIKKKKYAFGRKENVDKLKFPQGHEPSANGSEDSDLYKRLRSKGVIYEVKLLDWIDRMDIDGNGNFLKSIIVQGPKKEWEKPSDIDEITVSIKATLYENDPSF